MSQRPPRLLVTTSPYIREGTSTPGLMGDVLPSLPAGSAIHAGDERDDFFL